MMPMLNYTTTVSIEKTLGEVQTILRGHGVARIATTYDPEGNADGLAFVLRTPHGEREFEIHVNVTGVQAALVKSEARGDFAGSRKRAGHFTGRDQAERVAWRVVKDWLEAQVALIEAEMATLDQVMLPYLIANPTTRETLYQVYTRREQAAIGS